MCVWYKNNFTKAQNFLIRLYNILHTNKSFVCSYNVPRINNSSGKVTILELVFYFYLRIDRFLYNIPFKDTIYYSNGS